jgi:hypothetical protein
VWAGGRCTSTSVLTLSQSLVRQWSAENTVEVFIIVRGGSVWVRFSIGFCIVTGFHLALITIIFAPCIGVSRVWLVNMMQIYQWVCMSVGFSGYYRVAWFISCMEVVR